MNIIYLQESAHYVLQVNFQTNRQYWHYCNARMYIILYIFCLGLIKWKKTNFTWKAWILNLFTLLIQNFEVVVISPDIWIFFICWTFQCHVAILKSVEILVSLSTFQNFDILTFVNLLTFWHPWDDHHIYPVPHLVKVFHSHRAKTYTYTYTYV